MSAGQEREQPPPSHDAPDGGVETTDDSLAAQAGDAQSINIDALLTSPPPPHAVLRGPPDPPKPTVSEPASAGAEWNQEKDREEMRGVVARRILWILAGVIAAAFLSVWGSIYVVWIEDDRVMRMIEIILGPIITLASAVTGFYFGTSSVPSRGSRGGGGQTSG